MCRHPKDRADAVRLLAHPFVASERLLPQLGPLQVEVPDDEDDPEQHVYLPYEAEQAVSN